MTSPSPDESGSDLDDAFHLIAQCSGYINNADTKAGFAAAAITVLGACIAQNPHLIADVVPPESPRTWAAAVALALFATAFIVTVAAIGAALIPRLPTQPEGGRFSYLTVASPTWRHTPASRDTVCTEAWMQATTLSRITARKFRSVRVALYSLGVATVALGAWVGTTADMT